MTYLHWLDLIKPMIFMQEINPSLTLQLLQMGWLLQLKHHHSSCPIMEHWGSTGPQSRAWCHEKASARPVQQTGTHLSLLQSIPVASACKEASQILQPEAGIPQIDVAAPLPGILSGASFEYTVYTLPLFCTTGSTSCCISHVALFYYYSPRIKNASHRKPVSWVFRAFPYRIIQATWKEAETKLARTDDTNKNKRQISTTATTICPSGKSMKWQKRWTNHD